MSENKKKPGPKPAAKGRGARKGKAQDQIGKGSDDDEEIEVPDGLGLGSERKGGKGGKRKQPDSEEEKEEQQKHKHARRAVVEAYDEELVLMGGRLEKEAAEELAKEQKEAQGPVGDEEDPILKYLARQFNAIRTDLHVMKGKLQHVLKQAAEDRPDAILRKFNNIRTSYTRMHRGQFSHHHFPACLEAIKDWDSALLNTLLSIAGTILKGLGFAQYEVGFLEPTIKAIASSEAYEVRSRLRTIAKAVAKDLNTMTAAEAKFTPDWDSHTRTLMRNCKALRSLRLMLSLSDEKALMDSVVEQVKRDPRVSDALEAARQRGSAPGAEPAAAPEAVQ